MANKNLVISLSFKEDEKWLYDIIKSHSGYSNWIKDIIKERLSNQTSVPTQPQIQQPSNNTILDEINDIYKK